MQDQTIERFYRELRCAKCHFLLLKEYVFSGYLEIKCYKCGTKVTHRFKHLKSAKVDIRKEVK